MDLTISGQYQSTRAILDYAIDYAIYGTVNGNAATVNIVGRKPFIGGWNTFIDIIWPQLNAGTYPYIIKKVSDDTVLLSGDIVIDNYQAITQIKTVNSQSLLGSGNITVGGGTFEGTLDDVPDGTTYKRTTLTEKNSYAAKVDPVAGKGLSTNDLTDTLKGIYDGYASQIAGKVDKVAGSSLVTDTEITKLSGIEAGAEVNNISDVNATGLTDGGETSLHSHASSGGLSQQQILRLI
jgi:hypothetical protein